MDGLIFVGVDTGNGDCKAVRWKNKERREFVYSTVPSIVGHGSPGLSPATGTISGSVYRLGSTMISVGGTGVNQVPVHTTGNFSIERKAVALEALAKLGLDGKRVAVATNLPLQDAVTKDDFGILRMDSEAIQNKCELLTGKDVKKRDGVPSVIEKAVCQPEGFAAYIDHVVGNDGADKEKRQGLTGFIDVGAGTCNVGIVAPGLELVDCFRTIRMGTNDIIAKLGELLEHELRQKGKGKLERFEPSMLRHALEQRKVTMLGETLHIGKLVDEAIEHVSREIAQQARAEIGRHFASLNEILLVGGGSLVIKDAFREWPGLTVPDKPAFANARGLLKLVTYLCNHKGIAEEFVGAEDAKNIVVA